MLSRDIARTAVVLALAGGLVGCGGSGTTGTTDAPTSAGTSPSPTATAAPSPRLLTKAELTSALIRLDDLGSGFKVDKSDDSDEGSMGCLDGLDELDKHGTQPTRYEEISYEGAQDPNLPGVYSTVGTFRTTKLAAKVLSELRAAVADCTKVDVTDKDGTRTRLAVTTGSGTPPSGATDEVRMDAVGNIGVQGATIPFVLRFSAIQVGNQVAVVGYTTAADGLDHEADAVEKLAFDRLAPIAAGMAAPDLDPIDLKVLDVAALTGAGSGSA